MSELKAVFFDVNGTLWDGRGCSRHVMDIVLPKFTPPFPEDETDEIIRHFNAALLEMPRREHVRERRPFSRVRRFELLAESYDIRQRGLAQQLSHTYDSVRRLVMRQFLRADAIHMLAELADRGLQRGVIVNGAPAVQRNLVRTLGIEPHVEHIVLGEVEGYCKPDVRLFERALELAGVRAEQALYVGDSPLTDVLGASRAGMTTAWFSTGRRLPKGFPTPDFTIDDLHEVTEIVDA